MFYQILSDPNPLFPFKKQKTKKEILESLHLLVLLSRRKALIRNDLGIMFPQLVTASASAEVQNIHGARSPGPQSRPRLTHHLPSVDGPPRLISETALARIRPCRPASAG